jgi:hypothetical protein
MLQECRANIASAHHWVHPSPPVLALDCETASEQAPLVPAANGLDFSDAQARPLLVEEFHRCRRPEDEELEIRRYRVTSRDVPLTDAEGKVAKAVAA